MKFNVIRDESGSVTIFYACILAVLLSFGALAIDLSYLFIVRNQLQNAADTAALSGARWLYTPGIPNPQWITATYKAQNAVQLNLSEGQLLTDAQIDAGYWNLLRNPPELQSPNLTPTNKDVAAIAATVSKESGKNGGPVTLFFANIFGLSNATVKANAVAAAISPSYIGQGGLFPLLLNKCIYDSYWDASQNPPQPKTGSTMVLGEGAPALANSGCGALSPSQLTSFLYNANDATTLTNLVNGGNPTKMAIGDYSWVSPGAKASVYGAIDACSQAGTKSCAYVTVPVGGQFDPRISSQVQIITFACIHVLSASQGGKTIQAELSSGCQALGAGGSAPSYGVVAPPKLVQ